MAKQLEVQEMAVVVAVQAYTPTILTPDFLKFSGIVPFDWELAQPPVLTASMAQIAFQNGITVVAQPNRLIFSERIAVGKQWIVDSIAKTYIRAQSQVKYQAVGINFSGYVVFEEVEQTARDYLFSTLLAQGSWQTIGSKQPQAAVRLTYTLEQAILTLDITDVKLRLPEMTERDAILFAANFNHDLVGDTTNERNQNLEQLIANWQTDLNLYQDIVTERFLGNSTPFIPGARSANPAISAVSA